MNRRSLERSKMNCEVVYNYLILGASSNIAIEYMAALKGTGDFYGLTTQSNLFGSRNFKKIITYDLFYEYVDIKFDRIFIVSSRNPKLEGNLEDYLVVNNTILNIINSVNFNYKNKPKITFLSSFSVYDKTITSINDCSQVAPSDFYGEAKVILEEQLRVFSKKSGINLLICRLPVLLYSGVSKVSLNFLSRLALEIKSNGTFPLTNPNSALSAVFDIKNLVELDKCVNTHLSVINCASKPDILFKEIGEIALGLGLSAVDWRTSNKPSVIVCLSKISKLLGCEPSAKVIVKNWLNAEVDETLKPN